MSRTKMARWAMLIALAIAAAACTVPAIPPGGAPGARSAGAGAPPATPGQGSAAQPAAASALPAVELAKVEHLAPESARNCKLLSETMNTWQWAEDGYDLLLPEAIQQAWSGKQYNAAVSRYVNAMARRKGSGGVGVSLEKSPSTNPCTCMTTQLDEACRELAAKGVPPVVCDAERAHEAEHRRRCEQNKQLPAGDPSKYQCDEHGHAHMTPQQRRDGEHADYELTLAMVSAYYFDHCSTCKVLAAARQWTGAVHVRYQRANRTNYTDEHLSGAAAYTSTLTRPKLTTGVNGYSATWMGPATGGAQFEDVEQELRGGRPFTGRGAGPLVPEPPLGVFGPEILRIDPEKCVYAFETSAAISSTWSDHTTKIEGSHVQLGGLPIAEGVKTLAGSRTLALPVSSFDWPGPAAHLPNDPIGWKARGHITGSITIDWSFTAVR